MTTIADARDALQDAVATTGLRAYAYIQDSVNAPCAHVVPLEFDPRLVLSQAKAEYQFQIRVYVSRAAAVEQNQKLLDEYRDLTGTKSLLRAIQDDTNWDGVDYFSVTRIGEVGVVDYGGAPYLMLELDVEAVF